MSTPYKVDYWEGTPPQQILIKGEVWHDGEGSGIFTAVPFTEAAKEFLANEAPLLRDTIERELKLEKHLDMFVADGQNQFRHLQKDGSLSNEPSRTYDQLRYSGLRMEPDDRRLTTPEWQTSRGVERLSVILSFGEKQEFVVNCFCWKNSNHRAVVLLDFKPDAEENNWIRSKAHTADSQIKEQLGCVSVQVFIPDGEPDGMDRTYKCWGENYNLAQQSPYVFDEVVKVGERCLNEPVHRVNLQNASLGNAPEM